MSANGEYCTRKNVKTVAGRALLNNDLAVFVIFWCHANCQRVL
jgi:hypothetical protein